MEQCMNHSTYHDLLNPGTYEMSMGRYESLHAIRDKLLLFSQLAGPRRIDAETLPALLIRRSVLSGLFGDLASQVDDILRDVIHVMPD
jgi:hypothetical protein